MDTHVAFLIEAYLHVRVCLRRQESTLLLTVRRIQKHPPRPIDTDLVVTSCALRYGRDLGSQNPSPKNGKPLKKILIERSEIDELIG